MSPQPAGSYLNDDDPPRPVPKTVRVDLPAQRRVTFVPAVAPGQAPARAYLMPAQQSDNTILDLGRTLDAQDLNENTTPVNRAIGFAIRVALLVLLLAVLAYGLLLVILFGDGLGLGLLLFAALAIGGYYWLSRLDYAHSLAGVEKAKLEAIERVTLDKQRGERALRREI